MVAYTTSTYNTGWMPGDIKLAALSDTDDTDLVGSGELVTNGTFDTDTDWTKGAGWTISGGVASFSNPSGGALSQNVGTISAGTSVVVEMDSYLAEVLSVGFNGITPGLSPLTLMSSSGTKRVYSGVLSATKNNLSIVAIGGSTVQIDNISVKLADVDRSVNNNGLIVNGTITRTFVDEV
jgi:hypothetical protein